jgi:hypothetical protein
MPPKPGASTSVIIPHRVEKFATDIMAAAEETLLRDGCLPFLAMFLEASGRCTLSQVAWPEDIESRDNVTNVLRAIGVTSDAVATVTVAEGFKLPPGMVDDDGEIQPPHQGKRISEHPDRIECLIFILSYRQNRRLYSALASRSILRDADGTLTGLEDGGLLQASRERGDSRLGSILLPVPPPAALRVAAREFMAECPGLFTESQFQTAVATAQVENRDAGELLQEIVARRMAEQEMRERGDATIN